ncbi:MAG: hypothetical protein ACFE9R_05235 [Candidatus Hermodarchaeota archaeon]
MIKIVRVINSEIIATFHIRRLISKEKKKTTEQIYNDENINPELKIASDIRNAISSVP